MHRILRHNLLKRFKIILLICSWFFILIYLYANRNIITNFQWELRIGFLFISFLLLVVSSFLYAIKIRLLTKPLLNHFPLPSVLMVVTRSNFLKNIPGGVWNHLGIFMELNSQKIKKISSANIVVINIVLTIMSATLFLYNYLSTTYYLILLIVIFSSFYILSNLLDRFNLKKSSGWIYFVYDYFKKYPKMIYLALIVNVLYWIAFGLAFSFFIFGLTSLEISLESSFSMMSGYVLSWTAGFLFLPAPSGIGVRELVLSRLITFLPAASILISISVLFRIFVILKEATLYFLLASSKLLADSYNNDK